uniref:U7-hexatoxin-Mg1a n=1 Tax=Macrothele gigas TaxID=223896 RepID=TXMG6_MACGS|nr:RecName: Full=U7-hexatoxin-Mg1a; Short=U7-HXTX-Mg1a; AltName: Full=Neurotoxin magi-6; Flags: Precursor [Macrothele gigas]BAD13410.1 Magi 6 [Macrothele gigas]
MRTIVFLIVSILLLSSAVLMLAEGNAASHELQEYPIEESLEEQRKCVDGSCDPYSSDAPRCCGSQICQCIFFVPCYCKYRGK